MKKHCLVLLATFILCMASATPATAQFDLLAVECVPGTLWDVNPGTGAGSNPRNTGVGLIVGITAAPDGTLYGLTTVGSNPANALITIDPVTGGYSLVGYTGLSNIYEGDLALDPTTGILYGIEELVPSTGGLWMFTIDRATGAATLVGQVTTTVDDLSAMAFDASGNCYIIGTDLDVIYEVDKTNANILSTVPLSTPLGWTAGMTFHPTSGTLYVGDGATGGTMNLYTCDPNTGAMTFVGPTGIPDGIGGFTFRGSVQASATFRNDGGNTNPTGYLAAPPVMGATWNASVDNTGLGNNFADIVGYSTPLALYLPGIGDYLLVNVGDPSGELLLISTQAGSGLVTFTTTVPVDPVLCGYSLSTQGYGFGGGGPRLHNAYDLVVGTD